MSIAWWKWLSALIVLTTLIVGLKAPLSPGIPAVSPDKLDYGATSVTIFISKKLHPLFRFG